MSIKTIKPQANLPLQLRAATLELVTPAEKQDAGEDVFRVTWTTGASVRRYDWENGQYYDEELVVTPGSVRLERLNSGTAPVLDTHNAYSIDDVKGVVLENTVSISNSLGYADLKLDDGPENQSVLRKVQNGIIRNVSIGYRVYIYEVIQREGLVPLYRATDWEPYEISLVPIGADSGAGIRSATPNYPCDFIQPNPKETRAMPDNENKDPKDFFNIPENDPAENNPTRQMPEPNAPKTPETQPANEAPESNDAARADGVKAERARAAEIQKITRAAKLPETFAERCINEGVGIDKARKMAIDELARQGGEGGEIRTQVTIVRDEMDSCRSVVENALLNRYNPDKYKLESSAREFRGMSLIEIGRDMLERRGVRTRGLSRVQLAGEMLGLEARGGMHGTSDFPFILANVANKTLRDAYEAAPQTFKPFTRQTIAPDFKTIARVQLGDAPSLDKVNESGEFKRGTVSDGREQYALATYGKVVAINRQAVINDDLDAFTRLPAMFGRAAADLESDTVWSVITANANMGDGNALFSTQHTNLTGTGTAISVASLGVGRALLRQQKGINGRFINVVPRYLIVPTAQETLAQQFVAQTNVVFTKNADVNPFVGSLQVIAEPRLDASSALSWYLAGDPSQIDTIEYAYLEGNEGVYLESRVGFDVDGLELKARLDFAAKAIDWKGLYKNAGA